MNPLTRLRIVFVFVTLASTASLITSSVIMNKQRKAEQEMVEVLKKQNDTIKFQMQVIEGQSKTIARLKEALEERSKSKGPVVLNGRLNSE